MIRPQFTTREMLLVIALLSVGLGMLIYVFSVERIPPQFRISEKWAVPILMALFAFSGSLISAGLLLPFKKTFVGAMIGPFALLAAFFLYFIVMSALGYF